ncbi:polyprotein [Gigaspora margarita]|uniref:Polyprotein n=1 Tax=Gigaspora margarita TaxID=4874 RepID=A0A8H4AQI8_GIGMA|nr:polyprotein [Gigaspora margarita]
MLVNGKQNKKFDPLNGCAIGLLSAHAMPPKIFEIHNGFKHHIAMDVIAIDSTMTWPYMRMLKTIRKFGYKNYPQKIAAENLIDNYYDNLYNSYLWNMYTAFTQLTGMPASDFFKYNYLIVYSDDNVLSSNICNDKWNANNMIKYFAQCGISIKVEDEFSNINGIEFLSKQYYNKNVAKEHFEFSEVYKNSIVICPFDKDIIYLYTKNTDKFMIIENLISKNGNLVKDNPVY